MGKGLLYLFGLLYMTTQLFDGVVYNRIEEEEQGRPLVKHVLSLDMTNEAIRIENGFSFGVLYGFQKTSEIALREGALLAVNGMFYDNFGLPSGIIIHDGQPVRTKSIGTPTVMIHKDNRVNIEELVITGQVESGDRIIELYGVNSNVPDGKWVLFDPIYGSTTRVRRMSTNYILQHNKVVEVIQSDQPVTIDEGTQVLTYVGLQEWLQVGDRLNITFSYDEDVEEAFQSGGWLVRDGEVVAKAYEAFLGYTTAPQPRTLIGITAEQKLILMVVDGRQTGYSLGLSGKASAELMLSYGCIDAVYLDGGASSTMVMEGKVVNLPSGTQERAVAHSLNIFIDK